MDPLSVAASITGLLSAAASVTKALAPYVAAARQTPQVAVQAHSEMQSITIILTALQGLVQSLGSIPVQRAALIRVDHIVAVLTDGVLIFSDFEVLVRSLDSLGDLSVSITNLSLRSRVQWARKESEISSLLARLQAFKSSASLILNIMQSESLMRAEESQTDLTSSVNRLLESSEDLSRRLLSLEDSFDARSMVSRRRSVATAVAAGHTEDGENTRLLNRLSESGEGEDISQSATPPSTSSQWSQSESTLTSGFDFEQELEVSVAYRRAQRETMDFSFRSSVAWSNGISTFSGLTLGDISVLSVIALPIRAAEISNAHHYIFKNGDPPTLPASRTTSKHKKQAPTETITSLLYESLDIAIQLSHISFSDIFWKEGLYSCQEHPFEVLRRILSPQNTDLVLSGFARTIVNQLLSTVKDAAKFDELVCNGAVGVRGSLVVIKAVLTRRAAPGTTIEPFRLRDWIRKKSGYLAKSPLLANVSAEDFLAQERLYIRQLEDLPTVEKQMKQLFWQAEEHLSAIFTPLYEFMRVQLRLLSDIEQTLLLPPQSQLWSKVFEDWSSNTELVGKLISNETWAKSMLSIRAGYKQPRQIYHPQIVACSKLLSVPALVMLGYLEFLGSLEQHVDNSDTTRRTDISESKKILLQAHDNIARVVKQEDFSVELLRLRKDVADWKRHNIDQFGELLMYDANIKALNTLKPERPHLAFRVYMFEKILIFVKDRAARGSSKRDPGPLVLKGRIFLADIQAVVHSKPNGMTFSSSDCSCLVVYAADNQDAFEMTFSTPLKMQRWTIELRAAVKTARQQQPEKQQHGSGDANDLSKVPSSYPGSWEAILRDRGYLAPED